MAKDSSRPEESICWPCAKERGKGRFVWAYPSAMHLLWHHSRAKEPGPPLLSPTGHPRDQGLWWLLVPAAALRPVAPEHRQCHPVQPRPSQGTETDCRGVREQAEAVTIENKDFIIFCFPVHRTVPITQTMNGQRLRSQQSPGLTPSVAQQGLLGALGSCRFP